MTSPAPGWYPDPAHSGSMRWWDGQQWTDHMAPGQPGIQGMSTDDTAIRKTRTRRTRNTLLIVGATVLCSALLSMVAITAINFSFGVEQSALNTEIVSTNESGYAYTEAMLDLNPETNLTFPVDFDWDTALAEAGGMENWAFELYLDPTLTRFERAWVYQNGAGNQLEIRPFESGEVHGDIGSGSSAAIMPEDRSTSGWGLQPEYYLVRKIDSQGKLLETPIVTKLTTKQEFESPTVTASVNPTNGTVELSWEPVAGATNYVVVGSAGIRTEKEEYRYYTLFGTTDGTSWSSKGSLDRNSPGDFYPTTQNVGLELFDDESADDLLGDNVVSFDGGSFIYEQSGFSWGVVATNGSKYSRVAEVDASSIAGSLPLRTAWNKMVQWGMSSLMSDVYYTLDNIPREYAFTSLDGVTRTTQARIPDDGITVDGDTWFIKVEGVGTQLGEEIEFNFYRGAPTTPETFLAQFNAEAESRRPATGLGNYTVISGTPEEVSDAIDSAATKPAKTPYPAYGSDEYVRFLASHIIAGTDYVNLSEFATLPGTQSLRDAFQEALLQNPYSLAMPYTQEVSYNLVASADDRVIIHLTYALDQGEREEIQASMAEAVDAVLAQTVNDSMSASDKAVAVNDWVTSNTEYDHEAFEVSQSGEDISSYLYAWRADGVFDGGLVVCLGYAHAYSALMNAAGVPTVVVTGDVLNGGGHAWNKVSVDGNWLSVDPTWNDTDYAPNQYLLIPDSGFTDSAERVEDLSWIRDDRAALYATP